MINKASLATLSFIIVLTGCSSLSTTASFYPIEGPLSKVQPLPVLTATADGITGNTGNISLTLPDGEFCKGRWSSIAPMSVGFSKVSARGSVTTGMTSAWATVYGSGYSISNLPGVNKGEAMFVCDRGTVIQFEFYTGSGTANVGPGAGNPYFG